MLQHSVLRGAALPQSTQPGPAGLPFWHRTARARPERAVRLALVGAALLASPLPAQQAPLALVGARILPVAGDPIEEGTLVIEGGRIVAVGPSATTAVPEGTAAAEGGEGAASAGGI